MPLKWTQLTALSEHTGGLGAVQVCFVKLYTMHILGRFLVATHMRNALLCLFQLS